MNFDQIQNARPTKKTRVALVAPPANYTEKLYGFKSRKAYRNQPPLGIGYLASTLIADGFGVYLLDASAENLSVKQAADRVIGMNADIIGVSAITFEAPDAYALIRALRQRTDALIVLGGPHANSYYPQVPAQCPELDVIVAGEGEETLLEIARKIEGGGPLGSIQGAMVKQPDGSFTKFVERPPVKNLDDLPMPAYHLYQHGYYRPLPHRRKRLPATCMITCRGCSYGQCTYCELSGLIRKAYRRHSAERVVEEMRVLKKISGAREVYFQDDIFITEHDWVRRFCDELDKADLDIIWSCETRLQGLTLDLLERMKKSGCWRVYYGFESGNQDLLDGIRKGFTLDEARRVVDISNRAGLDIVGFFMLALPGETPEKAERTIEYARNLGVDHAIFSMTVPHPNTELYRICQAHGIIIEDHLYYYKKASFIPEGYQNAEQIEALWQKAFRRFYFRSGYFKRCLSKIRSWEDFVYYLKGFLSFFKFID